MKNVPYSFELLNAWSPGGGAVPRCVPRCGPVGGYVTGSQLWKFKECLVHYLYPMLAVQGVSPQLPDALPAVFALPCGHQPSGRVSWYKLFLV